MLNPIEIENRSFSIIESIMENRKTRQRYDEVQWEIVKRVVHTTGDPTVGEAVLFSDNFFECFKKAISHRRIITDVSMVLSGISKVKFPMIDYRCHIADEDVSSCAKNMGISRAYAGIDKALKSGDALFVIGNAPTALRRLLEGPHPSFVIGVPVGFVGAAEWKAKLIYSDIPYISISGSRGGSTIAAAITNALLKCMDDDYFEFGRR